MTEPRRLSPVRLFGGWVCLLAISQHPACDFGGFAVGLFDNVGVRVECHYSIAVSEAARHGAAVTTPSRVVRFPARSVDALRR